MTTETIETILKRQSWRLVTFEILITVLTIENLNSWQSLIPDNLLWHWTVGRVEKSKNVKNLIGYCFSGGLWSIETYKKSLCKKIILAGWNLIRNLGFGHFQRFFALFFEWPKIKFILTQPSMAIAIWNLHAKSFPMVYLC